MVLEQSPFEEVLDSTQLLEGVEAVSPHVVATLGIETETETGIAIGIEMAALCRPVSEETTIDLTGLDVTTDRHFSIAIGHMSAVNAQLLLSDPVETPKKA